MAKLRKGDEVLVRAGKDKGKRGTVLSVTPDDHVEGEGQGASSEASFV